MNFRRFILTPHGRGRGPPGYHLSALKASRCRIANSRLNEGCCCEGFSDAWMTTASPTHRQQASEKRQGTKSRGLGTRRCSSDYGDYMSGPLSRGQRAIPLRPGYSSAQRISPQRFSAVALDGKSRRCNSFGSYRWYKRRSERVDFWPGFDPEL